MWQLSRLGDAWFASILQGMLAQAVSVESEQQQVK
jgi:hypothetical protein